MKSQTYAMTAAARLAACALLVVGAVALFAPRASAQQNCVQVKMIYAEAWNILYMIDGAGNRLRDIGSGNTLSNRQVDSYIVLRSTPSSIGIEIAGTGEKLYDTYKSNVKQSGDRGYEDFTDGDYDDAVILIAPISCSAQGSPPQQYVYIPPGGSNPPQTDLSIRTPVVSSVSADSITTTSARAVVAISDHDGSELTVRLRYQQKAESQDWTDRCQQLPRQPPAPARRRSSCRACRRGPSTSCRPRSTTPSLTTERRRLRSRRGRCRAYSRSASAISGRLRRGRPSA